MSKIYMMYRPAGYCSLDIMLRCIVGDSAVNRFCLSICQLAAKRRSISSVMFER